MKLKIALIAAIAFALAGTGWMLNQRPTLSAPVLEHTRTAAAGTDPELAVLLASPQAQTLRERQDFEVRAKRFLQNSSSLGEVERSEQARALIRSIDHYERNGGLSAGEALLLRSGLIKVTVADEQQQAMQTAELMERYRTVADQRMADHLAQQQRDPKFQDYKTRERAIVAEVMAMRQFPRGLSRDEYLRQRLQQAREIVYR